MPISWEKKGYPKTRLGIMNFIHNIEWLPVYLFLFLCSPSFQSNYKSNITTNWNGVCKLASIFYISFKTENNNGPFMWVECYFQQWLGRDVHPILVLRILGSSMLLFYPFLNGYFFPVLSLHPSQHVLTSHSLHFPWWFTLFGVILNEVL